MHSGFLFKENPILNIGSPIDFLSEKLISNFQKNINSSIKSITYTSNTNTNFNDNNYDILNYGKKEKDKFFYCISSLPYRKHRCVWNLVCFYYSFFW